jgi:hypothetical protein
LRRIKRIVRTRRALALNLQRIVASVSAKRMNEPASIPT